MSFIKEQERFARKSMQELLDLRKAIEDNPASLETAAGSIHIYNRKARKMLHAIAWAITFKLEEKK